MRNQWLRFIEIFYHASWIGKLLLLFILYGYSLYGLGQSDINFSKLGIEEGLSQLSVMAVYQDELGNMWFGTREGVSIYNGGAMKTLHPGKEADNSLSGNLIKAIHGNSAGSVFIHTQNGIDEFDMKTGTLLPRVKMQVNAMNWGHGHLYYAKEDAIFIYQDETSTPFCRLGEGVEITILLPASGERLFAGTIASGVYEVSPNGQSRRILDPGSRVSSLFEDSNNNIWVSTWEKGLYKIEADSDIVHYRQDPTMPSNGLSSDFVRAVQEDEDGNIWIGTRQGLDKLDKEQSLFYHYDSEAHDDRSLSHESVWSLYKDSHGNIWVGTYFGGVNYFHPKSTVYTFHNLANGTFATRPFPVISEIIPYMEETVLLCTEGDGLIVYNTKDRTYSDIPGMRNENIKSAHYDKTDNKLYLGLHLGGLSILDLTTKQLVNYPEIRPDLDQSNVVRKILPYRDNYLIATHNGLYLFDKNTASFSVFSDRLHQHVTYFVDIAIDEQENLWIASRGVYKHNLATGETKPFFHDPEDLNTLSNNNAVKLFVDTAGRLWVGTSGGGINLFDYDSSTFSRFTTENSGLVNNYVSNISESPLGLLYITTTRGLSYFSPGSDKGVYSVSHEGLPLNSLFNGGITIKPNGEIFVAGMNGMVSFHEKAILEDVKPFHLYFTNLWVNN